MQWRGDLTRLPEILHGVARTAHELTTNALDAIIQPRLILTLGPTI